jgi:putative SOS response-associated peptidase YedK
MCGRFGASYRDLKIRWNLHGDFSFRTRYNIAPSQEVPVIVRNEGHNEAKVMKWGLVPSWAPDPSMGQRMINARSETLLEKPSFKQAVEKRRAWFRRTVFTSGCVKANEKSRCGFNSKRESLLPSLGFGTAG